MAQNVEHDIQASHAQLLINNVLAATESITLPNTAGQKMSTRYQPKKMMTQATVYLWKPSNVINSKIGMS